MKLTTEKQLDLQMLFGVSAENEIIKYSLNGNVLVAGGGGTGKTVFNRTLLTSMLYTSKYDDLKLLIIDRYHSDFLDFNDMPFMLENVVNSDERAIKSLESVVETVNDRLELLCRYKQKNIRDYNEAIEKSEIPREEKLSHIVVLIDDINDVIENHEDEMIDLLKKIGIKGRSVGVNFVVTSSSPRASYISSILDVIDYKTVFATYNKEDSMKLLGVDSACRLQHGGSFYLSTKNHNIQKGQALYISDEETNAIFDFIKSPESIDIKTNNEKDRSIFDKFIQRFKSENNEKVDISEDTLFPTALFNENSDLIRQRKELSKKFSSDLELNLNHLFSRYKWLDNKNKQVILSHSTITYVYKIKPNEKIPDLGKIKDDITKSTNICVELNLKSRNIQFVFPLPRTYWVPINNREIFREISGN